VRYQVFYEVRNVGKERTFAQFRMNVVFVRAFPVKSSNTTSEKTTMIFMNIQIRISFCKGRYSEYCLFFVVNLNVAGNITSFFRRGRRRWRQKLRRLFYVFKNCKNSLYIYNKLLFVVIKALEPLCKTVRRSLKTTTLVVSLFTFSSSVALSFLFCLYSSFERQIVGALFFAKIENKEEF
jgi:hypothetical protein